MAGFENTLSFNQYVLVDMDSGINLKKSRHEIEKIFVKMLTGGEDFKPELTDTSVKELTIKTENKRFKDVTEQEMDELALNRNSMNMKKNRHFGL